MTTPQQSTATAIESALKRAFPQTAFTIVVAGALDTIEAHWRGGPSHDAVNAAIAQAGREIGFQYTPSEATTTEQREQQT